MMHSLESDTPNFHCSKSKTCHSIQLGEPIWYECQISSKSFEICSKERQLKMSKKIYYSVLEAEILAQWYEVQDTMKYLKE